MSTASWKDYIAWLLQGKQLSGAIIINKILGARLALSGNDIDAVLFKSTGASGEYFDATGKSLRGVHAILAREELSTLFATIQTADTHPSKPDPSMLLTAMDETGCTALDTVMIGDTTFDIEMARAAGVHAIGVDWGYHDCALLHEAGAHCVVSGAETLLERLTLFAQEAHEV